MAQSSQVQTRKVWFVLVDTDGSALSTADSVRLPTDADVADFRDAMKSKYADSHLAGIAASDLLVYPNRAAVNDSDQSPLEEDSSIGEQGRTKRSALAVVVPKRRESKPARSSLEEAKQAVKEMWFMLVDAANNALSTADSVRLPIDGHIADFRDAVKSKGGSTLSGLASSDLLVYTNADNLNAGKMLDPRHVLHESDLSDVLRVVVPDSDVLQPLRKRLKTNWVTSTLGTPAVYYPNPRILRLPGAHISGFGVRAPSSSDDLVLYRRADLNSLLMRLEDGVLNNQQHPWIIGPPGCGKSATAAAFALSLAHSEWVVTWIHFGRRLACCCVRLDGNVKKTTELRPEKIEYLYEILGQVDPTRKNVVFLDGLITPEHTSKLATCTFWLKRNREKRRLVVVSSMASRGKSHPDTDSDLNVEEYAASSWQLDEYLDAVQDNELLESVGPQLDASVPVPVSKTECGQPSRDELVKSKHYFAGGSARYMFAYNTANVMRLINEAASTISDAPNAASGASGERSSDVVNRLYSRFTGANEVVRTGIISHYAALALAIFGGSSVIQKLSNVIKYDSNPVIDGWMLEVFFFARIRNGGVILYHLDGTELQWPQATVVVASPRYLPHQLETAPAWIKPPVYNQGGYDAVYIDKAQGIVRFVQVTRASMHGFSIGYFYRFLDDLRQSKQAFEIKTFEIFFVVEKEVLEKDFQLSPVSGEGLLAPFGWEKGKEVELVKRVGMKGPQSWDAFG